MTPIKEYLTKYCAEIGIPPSDILGKKREQSVSIARQVFCLVAKSKFPLREIYALMSRDRVTVMKGMRHAQDLLDVGDGYAVRCFETCAKIMKV